MHESKVTKENLVVEKVLFNNTIFFHEGDHPATLISKAITWSVDSKRQGFMKQCRALSLECLIQILHTKVKFSDRYYIKPCHLTNLVRKEKKTVMVSVSYNWYLYSWKYKGLFDSW